ncbi:MAG: hypothetical protein AB4426_07060 [Xenococcaceae cyanobacterium]
MKSWQKLICLFQIPALLTFSIAGISSPVKAQGTRIQCWDHVRSLGGSRARADSICKNEPSYAGLCAEQVRNVGGSWDRAESLCKNGTRFSGTCFQQVRNAGATLDHAESLCKNALANTGQCVRQARNEGFAWNRTLSECRRPSVSEALQECMNSIMFDSQGKPTGISEVAAFEECRRARTRP